MILNANGKPARRDLRANSMQYAFDAAKRSSYRNWFFFPSLDPQDQMIQWTREEIARKINWLYNNVGVVRLVIDGLSKEEVDTGMWPRATTSNPKFNKAVTDAFDNDCGDARFFDEAGVENFYTQQLAIRRNIYLFGELFGQLLRPSQGSTIPTIHTIPMWQVGGDDSSSRGGSRDDASSGSLLDGTRANKFGRVFSYRVYTNKKRSEFIDVPADDMLHFHDPFWKGQRRGMSCLASVAKKLFRADDIERVADIGELMRQRVAYQITRSAADDDEPTLVPGATLVDTIEADNPDGTKSKLYIQRISSTDGNDIDIADLPPGREIQMVESQKGGDAIKWTDHILFDVAASTTYPNDYVFNMAGVGQGTVYRGLTKRVQRIKNIARQFQLRPQFVARFYPFWLWQTILGGRFDDVEGGIPTDWYKVRINVPPDDSVDVGREGALNDDRVDSGKMTLTRYHAIDGEDAEDVEDEIIADRVRRLKKIEEQKALLEDRVPDYTTIAHQISYDTIFRESKTAITVHETAADLEDMPPGSVPTAPLPPGGHRRNGHIPPNRLAHV